MTAQPQHMPPPDAIVKFTTKGERALDALARTITNQMATTPEGIAQVLDMIWHTPIEELATAFTQIATELENIQSDQPPATSTPVRRAGVRR